MSESIHQFVIDELQARKGTWPVIAGATRISRKTIEKIATRTVKNPGVKHIETLARYFRSSEKSA